MFLIFKKFVEERGKREDNILRGRL